MKILRVFYYSRYRHCERSKAISTRFDAVQDCFAALGMTNLDLVQDCFAALATTNLDLVQDCFAPLATTNLDLVQDCLAALAMTRWPKSCYALLKLM
jgi:hypothetical protein